MLTMCHRSLALFFVLVPCAVAGLPAAEKDEGGKLAGILMDKKAEWITVKADGEDEAVKYLIGNDRAVTEALKNTFNASRVQLTWKKTGEGRQLVDIKKQVLQSSGTVTGTFVAMHGDFWIEVKFKSGVSDAFAPGANYKDKEFMDSLRALKKGDSVTITFTTDFERHRIVSLKKN
jgi:hypothetical protein